MQSMFHYLPELLLHFSFSDWTDNREAKVFMELLKLDGAEVLVYYDHYNWNGYAAVTRNHFAEGYAILHFPHNGSAFPTTCPVQHKAPEQQSFYTARNLRILAI